MLKVLLSYMSIHLFYIGAVFVHFHSAGSVCTEYHSDCNCWPYKRSESGEADTLFYANWLHHYKLSSLETFLCFSLVAVEWMGHFLVACPLLYSILPSTDWYVPSKSTCCALTSVSLSLSIHQGCRQYLGNEVLRYLYNIGAIGMAFATFEVCLDYMSDHWECQGYQILYYTTYYDCAYLLGWHMNEAVIGLVVSFSAETIVEPHFEIWVRILITCLMFKQLNYTFVAHLLIVKLLIRDNSTIYLPSNMHTHTYSCPLSW